MRPSGGIRLENFLMWAATSVLAVILIVWVLGEL